MVVSGSRAKLGEAECKVYLVKHAEYNYLDDLNRTETVCQFYAKLKYVKFFKGIRSIQNNSFSPITVETPERPSCLRFQPNRFFTSTSQVLKQR